MSVCKMAKFKKLHRIIFLGICIAIIITISSKMAIYRPNWEMYHQYGVLDQNAKLYKLACRNVLDKMVLGYWVRNDFSQDEMDEVENFHKKVRKFNGIPSSLQRDDGRCGNVHFQDGAESRSIETQGLKWFRALCDPDGTLPCCFQHKCVARSVDKCKCEQCYDVRQQIHAELSTWVPVDPTCKITTFLGEHDTCDLLRGMTFYFMGDSFMRELYIALLELVKSNKPQGALKKNVSPEKLQLCDRFYRMTGECKPLVAHDERECHNTTRLRRISFWKAKEIKKVMTLIKELQELPNSFVILGAGIHEGYNSSVVENQIVEPLLRHLAKSPWPKPIWLATHSPGLLKAPKFSKQQTENVVKYNHRINAILRKREIPILDFFQLTKGVMSYDGTHYGRGVIDVKAQIFLNYILEIKSQTYQN